MSATNFANVNNNGNANNNNASNSNGVRPDYLKILDLYFPFGGPDVILDFEEGEDVRSHVIMRLIAKPMWSITIDTTRTVNINNGLRSNND